MKTIDFNLIGRKIRQIRLEKGLTQEYISNIADVNISHISNIEKGRTKISLTTLVHVCNALDTTVDRILNGEYTSSASVLDHEILKALQNVPDDTKEKILKIIQIL